MLQLRVLFELAFSIKQDVQLMGFIELLFGLACRFSEQRKRRNDHVLLFRSQSICQTFDPFTACLNTLLD
jgi:hypothetical protein